MTTQSRFNPDGSLHLNGDLFINEQGNLTVGGTANVTGNVNISGSTVIEGDLRVEGTTTYISDTVAQNSADGYIIDFDNDASSSFYQFGSAGAKLSWDVENLTLPVEYKVNDVSSRIIRVIQSYTSIVNKVIWNK